MNETRHTQLFPIPVFYSGRMLADSASYSPSAHKPADVLTAWQDQRLLIDVRAFDPCTEADLYLAHDPTYVSGVLAGEIPNGFGSTSAEVAASLPYTSGAMLAAAREALTTGVACAPVSGFHHAHYYSSAGFCTFNGLIVTAQRLLTDGEIGRVLIVDCDMHYGDGTDQILGKLGLFDRIGNDTFGRNFSRPSQAAAYLKALERCTQRFADYDLILYQAGADVHVDDPLGGVLTTQQMIQRDAMVFSAARQACTPLAWNLAGGYQRPLERVISLHVNTMIACCETYCGGGGGGVAKAASHRA